jgi:hypothetical protein
MRCYLCGRRLARAAATVKVGSDIGHAGPKCARAAGLLPARVQRPRLFELAPRRRRKAAAKSGQLELLQG